MSCVTLRHPLCDPESPKLSKASGARGGFRVKGLGFRFRV